MKARIIPCFKFYITGNFMKLNIGWMQRRIWSTFTNNSDRFKIFSGSAWKLN